MILRSISLTGLNQLKQELRSDHSKKYINALCTKTGDKFKFSCFQSAAPLEDIKIHFDLMFQKYPTETFCNIWEAHMRKASKSEMCIEDIKTHVWEPTFRECTILLESIYNKTIELSQIDHYFKPFKNQKKREKELMLLHSGISQCIGERVDSNNVSWVHVAVDLMEKYWSLHTLADAANIVLTLRDSFSLTGDFGLIETLAQQVYYCVLMFCKDIIYDNAGYIIY